jgi:Dihaem cytochrome c
MRGRKNRIRRVVLLAAVSAVIGIATARADTPPFAATNPVWREQCGSCHIPYPPALLPAASWRALMVHLDHHFGVNVKVAASKAKTITAFLEANAGRAQPPGAPAPLRITETSWFAYEHDDVPTSKWTSTAVKSAAHCPACHARAARGDFSKRTLKMPRKP